MKKTFVISAAFLFPLLVSAQLVSNPSVDLTFHVPGESGTAFNGTHGCAIGFNSDKQLYYTVIGGNASFPLCTFGSNGTLLHQVEAGADTRGMWWNPKTKKLEATTYSDIEVVEYGTGSDGYCNGDVKHSYIKVDNTDLYNTPAVFDSKKNRLCFYDNGSVFFYDRNSGKAKGKVTLDLPGSNSDYNYINLIWTGVSKMEIGILNVTTRRIYLFDAKSGKNNGVVMLPPRVDAPDYMHFAFANKHVFIWNSETRMWKGFKIFN